MWESSAQTLERSVIKGVFHLDDGTDLTAKIKDEVKHVS